VQVKIGDYNSLIFLQEALLFIVNSVETPGQLRSTQMSYQYDVEIAKTQAGTVDLDFYKQEASRLRSELLLKMIKSSYASIKNACSSLVNVNTSPANIFLLEKLAK
jgi:hypothetical protein